MNSEPTAACSMRFAGLLEKADSVLFVRGAGKEKKKTKIMGRQGARTALWRARRASAPRHWERAARGADDWRHAPRN